MASIEIRHPKGGMPVGNFIDTAGHVLWLMEDRQGGILSIEVEEPNLGSIEVLIDKDTAGNLWPIIRAFAETGRLPVTGDPA